MWFCSAHEEAFASFKYKRELFYDEDRGPENERKVWCDEIFSLLLFSSHSAAALCRYRRQHHISIESKHTETEERTRITTFQAVWVCALLISPYFHRVISLLLLAFNIGFAAAAFLVDVWDQFLNRVLWMNRDFCSTTSDWSKLSVDTAFSREIGNPEKIFKNLSTFLCKIQNSQNSDEIQQFFFPTE